MMHQPSTTKRLRVLILAICIGLTALRFLSAEPLSPFLGAWRLKGGGEEVLVQGDRIVERRDRKTRVLSVLSYDGGELAIRRAGLVERWQVSLSKGDLVFARNGERRAYERLDAIPTELNLVPLRLGPMKALPQARVMAIQKDLSQRLEKDQEAIKSKTLSQSESDAVISGNLRVLRSLVQEIGWIDVSRFGSKTSYAAVILAKHGGDLSLLLAALPQIEKDFKHAGDDAQAFAIVYDSVQLDLGRKQRFGTQIRGIAEGKPFVLPLEDPKRVDEFRKEIGLPPLSEYLADAGKVLQMKINLSTDDESGVTVRPPAEAPKPREIPTRSPESSAPPSW